MRDWREEYKRLIEEAESFDRLAAADVHNRDHWELMRSRANMLRDSALVLKAQGDRRNRPKTGPGSVGFERHRIR